jgi:hypothetical protein
LRDGIQIHPAAELFAMMSDPELDHLAKDIEANGLRMGVAWASTPEGPVLLDGRNRVAALARIADEDRRAELQEELHRSRNILPAETDPLAYVFSVNNCRRHLTPADKRKLISKLLNAYPDLSDRAIARLVATSHTTVAAVRDEFNGQSGHKPAAERREASGRKARGRKAGPKRTIEQTTMRAVPLPNPGEDKGSIGEIARPMPARKSRLDLELIARLLQAVTGLAAMPAEISDIVALIRSSESADPVEARAFKASAWLKEFCDEWDAARTAEQVRASSLMADRAISGHKRAALT